MNNAVDWRERSPQGLVLADEPAGSCYLPEHRALARWVGADCTVDLVASAQAMPAAPITVWEDPVPLGPGS
ncbi:Imm21 family immunity protein [Streptomyces nodosus]